MRYEKEESPYKPEAFDSRSKRANAHVLAHKERTGFAMNFLLNLK
jgi:hypothetical protein